MHAANDLQRALCGWQLFARRSASSGPFTALFNPHAPITLSNALWLTQETSPALLESELSGAAALYSLEAVTPSLVVASPWRNALEPTLKRAGWHRVNRYGFAPLEPLGEGSRFRVEQVAWTQARSLAEIIATATGQAPYALALAQTLARTLEGHSRALVSYLAWDESGAACGAMIALQQERALTAFALETTAAAQAALLSRLAFDAEAQGLEAAQFVAQKEGGLELWQPS